MDTRPGGAPDGVPAGGGPCAERAAGGPRDSGVTVTEVTSPSLFTGPDDSPSQVVRVGVRRERPAGPLLVSLRGPRVRTPHPRWLRADPVEAYAGGDVRAAPGGAAEPAGPTDVVEVSVDVDGAPPGTRLPATATVATPDGRVLAARTCEVVTAEPGWTVRLVPHFHYDPLWWNTQAAYTSQWDAPLGAGEAEKGWEYTGVPAFTLVALHLQQARDDPGYRFVLSEVDYLKPFWDTRPAHREELRQLIREGRLEIVGGTYNEPSTNLISAETTVRSALHGLRLHRGVLGADPRTAWQLDVFGHDPSFPALMAGAGLDSAVLARGPHHQWGPMTDTWGAALRPPTAMQLPAEYEWIGPDGGAGLLLHYLPAHYSAGWFSHREPDADAAAERILELFELLRRSAATRNVLIPMGTDFSWPHPWGLRVQREWSARYTWPKLEHAVPREHFAAVRRELAARGEPPLPVTREMGPVYTGKDVTYIDVKQAQRATENLLQQAETFASLAYARGLAPYPRAALDKAWRHLLHAAHHDAVTGTFSDQVYLDLLPTWREAHELADGIGRSAMRALAAGAAAGGDGVPVTVFNSLSWTRTDVVRAEVPWTDPSYPAVRDETGAVRPVLVESVSRDGTARVVFLAQDVPGLGHRTWWLVRGTGLSGGWTEGTGTVIRNAAYEVEADPRRGGGLCRVTERATGREVLTPGEVDELVVQDEYPAHPFFGEGPWHLLPRGPGEGSASAPADSVRILRCPVGSRIVATGRTGPVAWTRTTTLWDGVDRVELTTRVDSFEGVDQLLRLRVPADVPGALPVAETAAAAVGRGFAFPGTDTGADHTRAPWTLDSPCLNWFGLSAPARVVLSAPGGEALGVRALGAAEIVVPDAGRPDAAGLRELVVALGGLGVTSTPTRPAGPRWGDLAVDSSLPDVRIALGGPAANAFTAAVLHQSDPAYARAVAAGSGPVWIPAAQPLREVWQPGCDLTGVRDLPVLVLPGPPGEVAAALARTGRVGATHPLPHDGSREHTAFEDRTVALLVRGTPGFAVDTRGRLHSSLLRSCTGRPSGEWMDPPRRTAPDGTSFQLQHWTHVFEHALVSGAGDWRDTELVHRGKEFGTPLAVVTGAAPGAGAPSPGGSLLQVDGLMVETVKRAADGGLAVRLREPRGRAAEGSLRAFFPVRAAARADLLDVPGEEIPEREGAFPLSLPGNGYGTVHLALPPLPHGTVDHAEPLQPVFTRYWLHNTGTAPFGDAPYAVTVTHSEVTVTSNGPAGRARLEVLAPPGWRPGWATRTVALEPGGHARFALAVEVPDGERPGDHLVRVVATVAPEAGATDGAGATALLPPVTVEDSLTVTVPGGTGPAPGIAVTAPTGPLRVRAGERVPFPVRLSNTLRSAVRCEALLVSPYGGWQLAGPRSRVVDVPADGRAGTGFTVRPPADTPPGRYWLLVKAFGQGRIAYSTAVDVQVTAAAPPAAAPEQQERTPGP
ncbi:NEW3 domain-containing protein [Streptomyces sp. HMX112]|uniref:glycoside hydrolase family 38 N-terminal domain-containing protein n=1 Tax=Streptomyces sp. HMX112 TaxID=3390850 RepID=UPI003A7FC514